MKLTKAQRTALQHIQTHRVCRHWMRNLHSWQVMDGDKEVAKITDTMMNKFNQRGYVTIAHRPADRNRDWDYATITDAGRAALDS